jgi:hypothetical protein
LLQKTEWCCGPSLGMNMRWQAEVQVGLKQNMGLESVEACHKPSPCISSIILS